LAASVHLSRVPHPHRGRLTGMPRPPSALAALDAKAALDRPDSGRVAARSRNARFLPWLLACLLLIAYSSTVVGPSGPNFVPLDGPQAWHEFRLRAFTWVSLGSDQRADWMGNLMMAVPLGFLLAGSLWPRRGGAQRPLAALFAAAAALVLALGFVLAVKFAQLFFPPRTVMLNYVVAQGIGAAVGIAAFGFAHAQSARLARRGPGDPRERLRLVLALYSAALFVFILMPLDFVLSRADLRAQLERLPGVLVAIPAADRPPVVQAALLVAGVAATVPFGMLLVLGARGRDRPPGAATVRGLGWMAVLWGLSTLVLSAAPSLLSLALRTAGIALGAWAMRWLLRQDAERLLYRLRRLSVWAVLPYLLLLVAVNGLVSLDWATPAQAWRSLYPLGLWPLFDYYIVSKAAAARNIVAHALMYAPIGVFVWLNGGRAGVAGWTAVLLAFTVEALRYLRPGLEGDVNAVAVAGLAALLAAKAMPGVWWMLKGVARSAARSTPRPPRV
jgi:hypothetical protein